MGKSRVLVVGGTGYLGKRIVKASLANGHPTYVLHRREIGMDIEKVQTLLSFKEQGTILVEGSFSDHESLVYAVRQVDVVICAISGVHIRSHQILLQLKLVDAIKEAGNIKLNELLDLRRLELRPDTEDMALSKDEWKKMAIRKAIEEEKIPFTYVSANCFAGYFLGGLCQPDHIVPSREIVCLQGDGNVKAIYVDEDDIATYTIKTIDDPRTLNQTLYIRPQENILSQREVVEAWESLIGKQLTKTSISEEDFLSKIKGHQEYAEQVGLGHYYHVCYEGCLTNFDIEEEGAEATKLYPEVRYTRAKDYLKRYV